LFCKQTGILQLLVGKIKNVLGDNLRRGLRFRLPKGLYGV